MPLTDCAPQIGANSTLPVTVSSVRVLQATNTRRGFLERVFKPLLRLHQDEPYTMDECLRDIAAVTAKLNKFGMAVELIYITIKSYNA